MIKVWPFNSPVLMLAFIFWYAFQLTGTVQILKPWLPLNFSGGIAGVLLGGLIAILGMGGIQIIKKISVWSFPVLFLTLIFWVFYCGHVPTKSDWGLSISGIITIGILDLPGFVNLSTFFRHSHSKADSILALSLMIIFDVLVQISSIFVDISTPSNILIFNSMAVVFWGIFIALTLLICVNLVNIYFASAALEMIFPRFHRSWNYFWIGIAGSVFFVFSFCSTPIFKGFLESFVNNCIINLGAIFIMAFFLKTVVGGEFGRGEKIINLLCWAIGCVVTFIVQRQDFQNEKAAFLAGISACMLSFLIAVFIQQFIFVIKRLKIANSA